MTILRLFAETQGLSSFDGRLFFQCQLRCNDDWAAQRRSCNAHRRAGVLSGFAPENMMKKGRTAVYHIRRPIEVWRRQHISVDPQPGSNAVQIADGALNTAQHGECGQPCRLYSLLRCHLSADAPEWTYLLCHRRLVGYVPTRTPCPHTHGPMQNPIQHRLALLQAPADTDPFH